jgi:hypothetical protein
MTAPAQWGKFMNRFKNPYGRCYCWVVPYGSTVSHAIPGTADTLRGVIYARTQSSSHYFSTARAPGLRTSGKDASCHQYRSTANLFLRLLRLFAICLRTGRVLWVGLFLQRHLPGYGPMVRLGI